jgi:hypothetical protein
MQIARLLATRLTDGKQLIERALDFLLGGSRLYSQYLKVINHRRVPFNGRRTKKGEAPDVEDSAH